jgi:hypothetical protein
MRMHPSILRAAASAVVLGCVAASAIGAEASPPNSHVLVIFTKPEKFSDVRDSGFPTSEGRDKILASLREFITRRAAAYIPAGDAFYINFVDIALAGKLALGDVENVRVFSRGSPPIFVFGWAITDRKGTVLRKGAERLREDEYMNLWSPAPSGDSCRFEKAVLDDWMRNNLRA